jgi:AraC family transcriptional regulator of adaptative response/methylated-DNA-[protein]-cysteine methyltransferase
VRISLLSPCSAGLFIRFLRSESSPLSSAIAPGPANASIPDDELEPVGVIAPAVCDLNARTGVCSQESGGNISRAVNTFKPMIAASMRTPRPMPVPAADDPRWGRVVARDKTADGHFWYSVSTTGVYCRPSCPSRAANPENVQFHDSLESAKATGFRPCRRCNPDGPSIETENAELVAKACRIIANSETEPSLEELADAIGRSPSYFHRVFKAKTGLTPKDYAAAYRARKVREGLASGNSVTEAIYDAGFNSSGRFYEKSTGMLGMTPSQYRAGGANEEIKFAVGQTFLGAILVASSKKGVAAILLGDDADELVRNLQDRFPRAHLIGADSDYEVMVARVVGFVEAPEIGLDLPLDVRGTAFQQRVWQALQEIPVGATVSYAELAQRIGAPKSVRAVAGACAANKLAVAIPCHRVVRNDGAASGYAWGVERKRALLDREASQNT